MGYLEEMKKIHPSVLTVVAIESDWIQKVREMVTLDNYFEEIKVKMEEAKLDPKFYQMKSGLIYYKGRLLISPCSPLIQTLISKHHDTPQGHSGYVKTMQRLKKIVNWKGLEQCEGVY